jgi:hypothetical protein
VGRLFFFAVKLFMVAPAVIEEEFFANLDVSVGKHADPVSQIAEHNPGIDVTQSRVCSVVDEAYLVSHPLRVDCLISVQIKDVTQLLELIDGTSPLSLISGKNLSLIFADEFIFGDRFSGIQTKAVNSTTSEKRPFWHATLDGDIPAPFQKVIIVVPVDWVQDNVGLA